MSVSINTTASPDPASAGTSQPAQPGATTADYDSIYDSAFASLEQMMQAIFAQDGVSASDLDGTGDTTGTDTTGDAGAAADSGMTAQSASGALAGYMNQNGIKTLNPDQLYQMAYNPKAGTPSDVTAAAKFMLQNPDVFNQIETHDVAGADGIAGANDFDWAAEGGLDDDASTQDDSGSGADTDGGSDTGGGSTGGNPMSVQSAAGALSSYMSQNSVWTLDPSQLYQLAYNPKAGTPATVSQAAKTMLENSDAFNQIETHDAPGADGIAGASDFQWAAQGGLSTGNAPKMNAQTAAGALASYMNQNDVWTLTPNQLYQMAYNPPAGTPSSVTAAAKYMLQHSSTFNQIESHDQAGEGGMADVQDVEWAAQGGLSGLGAETPAQPLTNADGTPMTAQTASSALGAYMNQNSIGTLDPNQLYQMAYHPQSGTPSEVTNAAMFMLDHPSTFNQIETHDVPGADGIAGANDFDWAAQGGLDQSQTS
jgi:hypothetical protein